MIDNQKIMKSKLFILYTFCYIMITIHCIVSTKPKVASCGKDFYTYIPNTNCLIPDGSSPFYQEPQLLCPLCDDHEFGWWYNVDVFPEFKAHVHPY